MVKYCILYDEDDGINCSN